MKSGKHERLRDSDECIGGGDADRGGIDGGSMAWPLPDSRKLTHRGCCVSGLVLPDAG
jgi:hypothetical protein